MNLSIRQQGNEIKSGSAAKTFAATERFFCCFSNSILIKAVLDPHDRVGFAGLEVVDDEPVILVRLRRLQAGFFNDHGQAFISEKVTPVSQYLCQRQCLIKVGTDQVQPDRGIKHFCFSSSRNSRSD